MVGMRSSRVICAASSRARDEFEAALAAFDFHGFHPCFLDEPNRVAQRFGGVGMVAAEGHVRDEQRVLGTAPHRPRVVNHLLERNRQRAVVTQRDHSHRIADEDDVHAGFVNQTRGRIVVRRQANDFVGIGRGTRGGSFALQKLGHGNLAVARARNNTHDGLRYRSLDQFAGGRQATDGIQPCT